MKYTVIKPFHDISGFKIPGESIELDNNRAAKLRYNGLIGGLPIVPKAETSEEITQLAGIYPESKIFAEKAKKAKKKVT